MGFVVFRIHPGDLRTRFKNVASRRGCLCLGGLQALAAWGHGSEEQTPTHPQETTALRFPSLTRATGRLGCTALHRTRLAPGASAVAPRPT